MNKRQQELFVAFFQQIYETEQILNHIKQEIHKSKNYCPNSLFNKISQSAEYISIPLLRKYLAQRVSCTQRELYELFERFDWSRRGCISREDFIKQLTPFGGQKTAFSKKQGSLTAQIEELFISLILEILKRFRIIEVSRKEVGFVAPYDAFSHIDYMKTGIIGVNQLKKLFADNDFQLSDLQLAFLLFGLRRRCYFDINLEVFCQNLFPLQFGEYEAYGNKIDEEKQNDLLKRSRHEEDTMRRSRLEAQKLEHQCLKGQRRRQAEIQRQFELQREIGNEISKYQEGRQRQIRRVMLEQDRNIRHSMAAQSEALSQEKLRALEEQIEARRLQALRREEILRDRDQKLVRSFEASSAAGFADRSLRTYDIDKEIALREQVHRDIEERRAMLHDRQLQISRRMLENQFSREQDLLHRQRELEKLRSAPEVATRMPVHRSRVQELEKELEKTRLEMQERRSRLQLEERLRRSRVQSIGRGYRY